MGLQRSDVSYQLQMLFKKFLLFFWPLYLMRDCSVGTQIDKIHAYNFDTHPSLKGEDSSCEMRVPTHENIVGGIYISLMYCTASATPFSYS